MPVSRNRKNHRQKANARYRRLRDERNRRFNEFKAAQEDQMNKLKEIIERQMEDMEKVKLEKEMEELNDEDFNELLSDEEE